MKTKIGTVALEVMEKEDKNTVGFNAERLVREFEIKNELWKK